MHQKQQISRRDFTKAALAVVAVPTVVSAAVLGEGGRAAPSARITMGVIGLGAMGSGNLRAFLLQPDTQVVAVCDVDSQHYRDRAWGQGQAYGREPAKRAVEQHYAQRTDMGSFRGCEVYADFRELCARDDIDAVVVATPDHWHARCTLEALRGGKDVYCEKPVTHLFKEGQIIYREVARRMAVFQTGSQQRSNSRFRQAVELVLNGHLGKIKHVAVGLPTGYTEPRGDPTIQEPPEHLDYDFWCGPGPLLPYIRARHHRFWRGHSAYGGGNVMDWIGHHNDIAHWALGMDHSGPTRVEAVGWEYPKTDVYDTPVHYEIRCQYPGDIELTISDRHRMGTKWIGEDGWVHVDRGRLEASDVRWTKTSFYRGPIRAYESPEHQRNFLDCVRSRRPCIAPAETAHRSITPGHLGYVSQAVGRPIHWDPAQEQIINDPQAAAILMAVTYRVPWNL